jgi:peptidyl-prolyl cis-trans isomerase A (cyclophilin A)
MRALLSVVCGTLLMVASPAAQAGTLVTMSTNFGTVKIDLFDDVVGNTVDNFLNYVASGTYTDTIIHRAPKDFVVQGGGIKTDLSPVSTNAPIALQYKIANTRGTIAMARQNAPNTATSQWFINTVDNTTGLGPGGFSTDGYAVFGWVVGSMEAVDAIAALPIYNGTSLGLSDSVPLKDYNPQNQLTVANMVVINSITVSQEHPSFQNPALAADSNNDGSVNSQDALLIINDLLTAGAAHDASATYLTNKFKYFDPNGDGRVNSKDLLVVFNKILTQNAAAQLTAEPMASPLVVPEPATWGLLLSALGALGVVGWRRRARRVS